MQGSSINYVYQLKLYISASDLLKLFINDNESCHTTDATQRYQGRIFSFTLLQKKFIQKRLEISRQRLDFRVQNVNLHQMKPFLREWHIKTFPEKNSAWGHLLQNSMILACFSATSRFWCSNDENSLPQVEDATKCYRNKLIWIEIVSQP